MATFTYLATDRAGKKIEGVLDAKDEAGALDRVRGMNYLPIKIESQAEQGVLDLKFDFFSRISGKEVLSFTQELTTLVRAGLPLDKCFSILVDLTKKKKMGRVVQDVQKSVHGGTSFADALARHPAVFSRLYVNMVRAGEAGGALEDVLSRLEDFLVQSRKLKDTVTSAMIYPLLLTFAGGAAVGILLTFVIPKFARMFEQSGQVLPLSTELLLDASFFIKDYWWALVIGVVALSVMFRFVVSKGKGREGWDRLKLKMPLLGSLISKIEVSRFSRTLGTLLKSGVPILSALNIVKETVTNSVVAHSVADLYKEVKKGGRMSAPLETSAVFPPLAVHMITVGEETGKMEEMLSKVAETFDEEIERSVKNLTSLFEPLMILIMGLVVGFIVISMLLAIFSMNDISI